MNITQVSMLLGHASNESTMVYLDVTIDKESEAMQSLAVVSRRSAGRRRGVTQVVHGTRSMNPPAAHEIATLWHGARGLAGIVGIVGMRRRSASSMICRRWHIIEYRIFSFISRNWHGRPPESKQVVVSLIANTTNRNDLSVECAVDRGEYPRGVRVADDELASLALERDGWHGEQSYQISPLPHLDVVEKAQRNYPRVPMLNDV